MTPEYQTGRHSMILNRSLLSGSPVRHANALNHTGRNPIKRDQPVYRLVSFSLKGISHEGSAAIIIREAIEMKRLILKRL
jgi:hypothetical protein